MSTTKVTTGKVRFSYPHVFEPKAGMDGGKEKYSVCLLVPKSDSKTVAAIKAAVKTAYENGVNTFGGKLPVSWKNPLRDGDAERPDSPEYAGMYFINASTLHKPQIVDANLNALMERSEFYAGCWGRASVNFYPFSVSGNKGVGAGLNNLQKLEDGERLGGGSTAADDFGTVSDDDIL